MNVNEQDILGGGSALTNNAVKAKTKTIVINILVVIVVNTGSFAGKK